MNQEEQFENAFTEYNDMLFRHVSMRVANRERAVELTQEAFIKTWDYLVKGETIDNYKAFLFRVLRNLIIDEYRKHKESSLDALLDNDDTRNAVEGSLLRSDTDIFEEVTVGHEVRNVMELLIQLPAQYQAVISMRYLDELSPTEIAESLQETENTVSVRLHRAVRKLRALATSREITQKPTI